MNIIEADFSDPNHSRVKLGRVHINFKDYHD